MSPAGFAIIVARFEQRLKTRDESMVNGDRRRTPDTAR
jgi:hypothetical protein